MSSCCLAFVDETNSKLYSHKSYCVKVDLPVYVASCCLAFFDETECTLYYHNFFVDTGQKSQQIVVQCTLRFDIIKSSQLLNDK